MPPLPHGPGMIGASHSHNPEYPDDSWNLYSMLDRALTSAMNVTVQADVLGVFKPFARRLDAEPILISDADEEIMIFARFTSPVHIRKIMVIGGGDHACHPDRLRCYVNQENADFSNIQSFAISQEFNLPVNDSGTVELITSLRPFTNVTSLIFYFPSNHGGGDSSSIRYIGMQGEHTHYRREAVDTVYEVLCNGQDIEHSESLSAHSPHLH
jgi:hypothetical protein